MIDRGELVQVKLFDEEHELDLEDAVNAFLNKHPQIAVHSIQFQTCCLSQQEEQIFCFSAMIVYENKSALNAHTNGMEVKVR